MHVIEGCIWVFTNTTEREWSTCEDGCPHASGSCGLGTRSVSVSVPLSVSVPVCLCVSVRVYTHPCLCLCAHNVCHCVMLWGLCCGAGLHEEGSPMVLAQAVTSMAPFPSDVLHRLLTLALQSYSGAALLLLFFFFIIIRVGVAVSASCCSCLLCCL